MSATPYVPLSWSDREPTSTEKLDQMTNNDQWLFENTPRAYYNARGVTNATGVKILAGAAHVPTNSHSAGVSIDVNFPSFFSTGCFPVLTFGTLSYPSGRVHVWHSGLGQTYPDERGFRLHVGRDAVNPKDNKLTYAFYVTYIAVGW